MFLKVEEEACGQVSWKLNNWSSLHHVLVAADASCYVEVGDPKVELRFFLRPKEKLHTVHQDNPVLNKWYSLCAEVLSQIDRNVALKVNASVYGGGSDLSKSKKFNPKMFFVMCLVWAIINFVILFQVALSSLTS